MFTSIWAALLVTGVFTVLLFIARQEAREKGSTDGYFDAMIELRYAYSEAYYDGFDDKCILQRDQYDAGYDDGWWEGHRDGLQLGKEWGYEEGYTDGRSVYAYTTQYEIERARADEAELQGQIPEWALAGSDPDGDIAEIAAAERDQEAELAELLAAERLMQALA